MLWALKLQIMWFLFRMMERWGCGMLNSLASLWKWVNLGLWDQLDRTNCPTFCLTWVESVIFIFNIGSTQATNSMDRPGEMHEVNVTCCQFPLGDANKYYVGSLNGAMYKNAMHNNNAEKINMYDEHDGPISSISINNPSSEYQALSGLVLTSSYDWTVKLWSPNSTKESMRTF